MKKNNYITPLLFAVFILSACHREELNPLPQTQVPLNTAFTSVSRIQGQVLSLYASLKSGNFYGGRYLVDGDVKADNFINESGNLITAADVWQGNPSTSATAVVNLWAQVYSTINNCNLFIDGMNAGGTTTVGAALGANYIAEAKLIRAVSYLSLLQFYALPYANGNGSHLGVPLRLTGIFTAGSSNLVRSSVTDVYTQIIKDLNDAELGLPLTYAASSTGTVAYNNVTRAHRNTAIALKTRVYLAMQQYDKVITEANKIVTATAPFTATSGYALALTTDYTKIFAAPYTTAESILSMPMTTTTGDNPGGQNSLASYYTPSSKSGGVGTMEFSLNTQGVISHTTWSATDKRRTFITTTTVGSAQKTWLSKFLAPSPYTDYTPVIRYAEVLLSLAEARVRNTNSIDAQAIALLNAVRQRSDPAKTFTAANFTTPTDLANAILEERNIEFLGEGLRNFDLTRLQLPIPGKAGGVVVATINPTDPAYIWPISASELNLNTLCVNN